MAARRLAKMRGTSPVDTQKGMTSAVIFDAFSGSTGVRLEGTSDPFAAPTSETGFSDALITQVPFNK